VLALFLAITPPINFLALIVYLAIFGVVLYLISLIPMDATVKKIIWVLAILLIVLWLVSWLVPSLPPLRG
jgi:hypothetical protein